MKYIQDALKKILSEQQSIQQELATLPKGSLIYKSGAYSHQIQGKTKGISTDRKMISKLSWKRYLLEREKQSVINIKHLKNLSPNKIDMRTPHELIADLPKSYQNLPIEYFFHPKTTAWIKASWNQSDYKSEERVHESTSGNLFRSKSERDIANQLERLCIPYRYEMNSTLSDRPILPDFRIRNPFTNKEIIWEHFGALHNPEYEKSMNNKMTDYRKAKFVEGETIIYTFESDTQTAQHIENIIKDVILS